MEEPFEIGDLDVRIIAALLAHPRARVGALAVAAGTSSPTVSRRLAALQERALVRVIGVVDQQRADAGFSVFLRLRCRTGASIDVAHTVAQWTEAGYVSVIGGDLDCVAQLHVASTRHLLEITNDRLTGIRGVTGSSTAKIIRRFSTPHGWTGGVLPESSLASLRTDRLDHWLEDRPYRRAQLDEVDDALVRELAHDGRRSWRSLADTLKVRPATVSRRVDALMESGTLRLRTVVQPSVLRQPVVAYVWLRVAPSRLEVVGSALAAHPNVLNIAATTGHSNLSGEVAVASDVALYSFITEVVGQLSGVLAVDVTDGLDVIKRGSLVFDPDAPERIIGAS